MKDLKGRVKLQKPLIKWTGGKFKEFKNFKKHIPNFDRYIEPFFGGGGVFFALNPKCNSYANDKSTDLINFYKQIGNINFRNELYKFIEAWDLIKKFSSITNSEILMIYDDYFNNVIEKDDVSYLIRAVVLTHIDNNEYEKLFDNEFLIDFDNFISEIVKNLISKINRVVNISRKESRNFSNEEIGIHIETAYKSGFYIHFRTLMNKIRKSELNNITNEKFLAIWYIVRELCYGSMFRFNKSGEFNIPYGGIAYNKKNLKQKVDAIFSDDVINLFSKTKLYNLDFEDFINEIKPISSDFMFIDPPYDSNFSEYDQNSFTRNDQIRLANILLKTEAKWMLVIKNTEFIYSLYDKKGINITSFDKLYTYNVRGRNSREAKHLIIMNY
ncbi:MAG: DNA adenine methylase [Bacteroidetes bacterium]|nr:MAG: DNA adenine methylase [Bacteroidota bacterium]